MIRCFSKAIWTHSFLISCVSVIAFYSYIQGEEWEDFPTGLKLGICNCMVGVLKCKAFSRPVLVLCVVENKILFDSILTANLTKKLYVANKVDSHKLNCQLKKKYIYNIIRDEKWEEMISYPYKNKSCMDVKKKPVRHHDKVYLFFHVCLSFGQYTYMLV